ncbi:MAG: site-specific tyrosine recombinase/integron integrase [Thermoplasmataceae archaeon]|jgi:integrase/recombinase XerD|nr:tyrosine-type recombinase/integrase [Candidatus Thermoplasmatota archaeon]
MENSETVDKFVSYMRGERKSQYTIKEYRSMAAMFLKFSQKKLKDTNPEDIERFKHHLATEKNFSKNSQYIAIHAVKLLFRSSGITPPMNLIPPKRSRKMPNYLSEKEASMLIKASEKDLLTNLIVSLLLYTGLRVGELCRINIDNIDTDEGVITVKGGKGDRDRIVIIPEICKDLSHKYLMERYGKNARDNAFLISHKNTRFNPSTVERIVKRVSAEAGIQKKVTPHVLRHTFATSVLRMGGDIRFIQQILGHASVATTQIYTHVDENTLREMYNKFGPKY